MKLRCSRDSSPHKQFHFVLLLSLLHLKWSNLCMKDEQCAEMNETSKFRLMIYGRFCTQILRKLTNFDNKIDQISKTKNRKNRKN